MGAGPDPRLARAVSAGQGGGWAKLAAAVAAEVPPAEIESIYLFRPIKREGREWGTAVVTRRNAAGRVRVYTAKYMLVVRGKERGQSKLAVEEVALTPTEVVERVMRDTADRTGDAEPPVAVGPGVWYEG
jgi:hypothetical protein